ncbi:protein-L-isoaspartate O-methyltransferase [Streptomyces platensis]|uniref:Protein-L-isoaspartate O-methyltransferase n=1 Tax=Streptomyces platensis TaxID=58346 RepID=A0ABX3XT30_STRPT|nr:methyltransferase domain-containing protein [Streptomyces platensis]OSY43024.1 Protein-L-isoaspartate O-methyltransferase [Streptomyces platensis]
MNTDTGAAEQAAIRGLLGRLNDTLPHPLTPEWEAALKGVARHRFLPGTVWLGDDLTPCDRLKSPEEWLHAAYADAPVITQVNDGTDPGDGDRWPSCSASAPSIVFRMLHMLDLQGGERVREIGTGTGWNAGLLSHRLGSDLVTTVEVDPALADRARANLKAAGLEPRVITGDAAALGPDDAPDRFLATCSVRSVPRGWVAGMAPGGIMLLPWETPWLCYGLLRLTADSEGAAAGHFHPHSAFMLMRSQRTDLRIFRDVVHDDHVPDERTTRLAPWSVTGDDWAAQFAIGLQLRDVWWAWHDNPDVDGVASRLWVATTDATSWAAIDWDGQPDERFTVWEHGPRRLWNEVEAAYQWWQYAERPGPEAFGMTVGTDGSHTPWLHSPGHPIPVTG